MAAKKKKKGGIGQLSFNWGKYDERVPKLLGILSIFLAVYLFIAFTSYIFTWQQDQDRVLRWSWGLLFQGDITMANWLGRLGAIVSNMFIYWGFGLPSFLIVAVMTIVGLGKVKNKSIKGYTGLIWYSFLLMIISSILFEFVFRHSEFPWGGVFGESICIWMTNFVGNAGMLALFLFGIIGSVVWFFNPNFDEMTREKALNGTRGFLSDLVRGKVNITKSEPETPAVATAAKGNGKALPTTLRPRQNSDFEVTTNEPTTTVGGDAPLSQPDEKGQLAFKLDKKNKLQRPVPLKAGEAELEIAKPVETPKPESPGPSVGPVPPVGNGIIPDDKLIIETDNKVPGEPYDPTLDLSSYEHPVLSLLKDYEDQKVEIDRTELENNKDQIIETLLNYKIEIVKIKATIGPTVTLYEIVPAPGVRISKIKNLEDDIALSLAALGIRIIAPIPGKGTIGIEVPNNHKQIVSLKEVLMSDKYKRAKMDLPIALGKTITNEIFVADLAKMPHLLIAGATGQGKSVGINTILMSLLYKKHPSQIKLVLIDPKKVELFPYSRLENHFLAYLPGQDEPIVTDTQKVVHTLNSLSIEMEDRYNLLKKAHARNIREYNEKFVARKLNPEKGHRFLPFIVLVIDEFADLIMTAGKEIELPIGRLAQLSRAVGIHLIIATQRPSVNIITGVIKANFPARLAFKVTAKVDSRTIIDQGGADRLIGRGDMLLSYGSDLVRLQCAFIDTPEVEAVIKYISDQRGYPTPYFLPEFVGDDAQVGNSTVKVSELDENFTAAARLVVQNQHGSTSMIQRRLKLGYNRAGRIMDQLEALGIVGPSEGSKAREVLVYSEVELERYLEEIKTRK